MIETIPKPIERNLQSTHMEIHLYPKELLHLVELNNEDLSRMMPNLTKTDFDATLDKISAVGLEYKAKLGFRTQHPGLRILIKVDFKGQQVPGEI